MELTVKQLKRREPESGTAVIDREALRRLDVTGGDFHRALDAVDAERDSHVRDAGVPAEAV